MIGDWVTSGLLVRLHAGVFAVGHAVLRAEGHYLAAVLACGDGAALSYRSAGALQKLRRSASARIDVTSPIRTGRFKEGIRIHRGDRLQADEVTDVAGIQCTTVPRTLLDLAVVLDQRGIESAVEAAEREHVFDLSSLIILLTRHRGRRGTRRLRNALEVFDPEILRCRSETEARFHRLVSERVCLDGIPKPRVNRDLLGYEVDFHWPHARLVVEVDSPFHDTHAAKTRDAERDAALDAAGWAVLRPRWDDIVVHSEPLILDLRHRLAAATG